MDSAAMFTLLGVLGGLVLAVAAAAVSYNEYLYRKARGETDGPWCVCCTMAFWRKLRQRLGCPGKTVKNPDNAVGGREVKPYLPPFKESVDCMFLVQRLKKDGLVDTAGAKRLSDIVASRDPRLLALVRKHTKNITADTVLTRNAEFQVSIVLRHNCAVRPGAYAFTAREDLQRFLWSDFAQILRARFYRRRQASFC